jgi:hypothetical protein
MLRALRLATFILVLPSGHASADVPTDLGANAALKYWQAFATLPKFTDAEQSRLMAEHLTMPLDAQARESVGKAEYALRMMHHGARLPRCDWGIGWEEDGVEVLLPQMTAARVLSSLACLRARMRFADGHGAEAIDDIVAAQTLGRQVSRDGSLIGVLVGYSIEARTDDALALYLPELERGPIKDLKTRLAALPEGGNPVVGLRACEEKTLEWFIHKVKAAKDKESLVAVLAPFAVLAAEPEGRARDSAERGRVLLDQCGGTASGVRKFAEATRPSYALMAEKLALPLAQFEKEFERETARQADNPVFKLFFPALAKVRRSQARADVRRALLSAAFAVRLDGPDVLMEHPDPVVGGPFEYTSFAGGFELRSKSEQDGHPLILTVGRRGK